MSDKLLTEKSPRLAELMFELSNDYMLQLDIHGNIICANPSFLQAFHLDHTESIGKNFFILMSSYEQGFSCISCLRKH